MVTSQSEIRESNYHFRAAWRLFAHASPGGVTFDQEGLSIANADHPWSFMNFGFLNRPAANDSDLECRASEAIEYFGASRNPWFFTASEDWLGPSAPSLVSRVGLVHKLDLTGMAAERLSPTIGHFPANVQLRRILDDESRTGLADLNADAYGVPKEWTRQIVGSAILWESRLFGTLAYVGGEPRSGAFAVPIDKALYVAWVATVKPYRRLGSGRVGDSRQPGSCKKDNWHRPHNPACHRRGRFCVPKDGISIGGKVSSLRTSRKG